MSRSRREPGDLSMEELLALVEGLREMMYGCVDGAGNNTWDPNMHVSGAELVAWVGEEMTRMGLVPAPGERV